MPSSTPFNSQTPLAATLVAAINHLLAQEAWARDALALHAGKAACIEAGGLALRMHVSRDGMLEASRSGEPASVTIRVRLADLPLIVQTPERAFSYVKIEGDAEFANTISQLSHGLRWEAELDLEPWVGQIVANRLVGGARSVLGLARSTQRKVAENLAEYFLEERPVLVRPAMVDDHAAEVGRLRDDVERTAKRVAKLEARLARRSAAPETTPRTNGQQPLDL